MAQEVSEYLSQNPRVAAWVEALRCDGETDKHWRHRRDFLLRNAGDLAPAGAADAESGTRNRQLQQLISFSMAWANHVFLGCRYPQKVMDKILSMAEGIKVTDAPTYTTRDELVAKVKKRGISSSNEGVEEPSKKRVTEGKNSSAVEQDHAKTSPKTERASAQQENSSTCTGAAIKSESGNSARSSGISSQNSSTSDGDRSVSSQSSSSVSSQVTAASGKASEAEAADKHGSASFVSLLKSSVNSHMTQSTDSRQQGGSPKKSALEGSSASASQSSSEIEVPLLGSSGSSEVELPLLSSKPSSETASSGLTSKTSSEATVSSSVAKNSSSSGTSLLTPKSSSSTNTSLLTSKSTSQVAASLLASKSSSQTSGSLVSKSTSLASVSQLASKSSSQTSTSQLPSKSTSQSSESSVKFSCKLTNEDVKQKQPFFNRLYKTVAWKLVAVGGFSPNVNHGELLNAAIEALKATLDVFFVPLKELADLPQNKSSQESIVCELRCKSVYLGTGCGKSKENAKAVASREALKLFLKKKVVVKICKRKYRGSEIEDLVLLDEESRPVNLPPALKHPQELL
uniref:CDKN2A interacting protein n=1 Tax=Rhinopithecus roxellana TaxID=61622 RepID=A0A2K6P0F3_RHIRO